MYLISGDVCCLNQKIQKSTKHCFEFVFFLSHLAAPFQPTSVLQGKFILGQREEQAVLRCFQFT